MLTGRRRANCATMGRSPGRAFGASRVRNGYPCVGAHTRVMSTGRVRDAQDVGKQSVWSESSWCRQAWRIASCRVDALSTLGSEDDGLLHLYVPNTSSLLITRP